MSWQQCWGPRDVYIFYLYNLKFITEEQCELSYCMFNTTECHMLPCKYHNIYQFVVSHLIAPFGNPIFSSKLSLSIPAHHLALLEKNIDSWPNIEVHSDKWKGGDSRSHRYTNEFTSKIGVTTLELISLINQMSKLSSLLLQTNISIEWEGHSII
jgi:hypothetical protein